MFPKDVDYREEAHIGEELFDDLSYELERQCMVVQSTVEKGIFSLERALKSYKVQKEDYDNFLAKQQYEILQKSIYGSSNANAEDLSSFSVLYKLFNKLVIIHPKNPFKKTLNEFQHALEKKHLKL